MILKLALLTIGIASLWLAASQWKDAKNRQGDFGDWIVSGASPLNKRLWVWNGWMQIIALLVSSLVCFAALGSLVFSK